MQHPPPVRRLSSTERHEYRNASTDQCRYNGKPNSSRVTYTAQQYTLFADPEHQEQQSSPDPRVLKRARAPVPQSAAEAAEPAARDGARTQTVGQQELLPVAVTAAVIVAVLLLLGKERRASSPWRRRPRRRPRPSLTPRPPAAAASRGRGAGGARAPPAATAARGGGRSREPMWRDLGGAVSGEEYREDEHLERPAEPAAAVAVAVEEPRRQPRRAVTADVR
ncbi:hypothetical protein DL771_000121 [Monosporascus sp. 5C6A]|nr:hypothetical protein DL771_000121 [Monosporascus sp. 5C6A]